MFLTMRVNLSIYDYTVSHDEGAVKPPLIDFH